MTHLCWKSGSRAQPLLMTAPITMWMGGKQQRPYPSTGPPGVAGVGTTLPMVVKHARIVLQARYPALQWIVSPALSVQVTHSQNQKLPDTVHTAQLESLHSLKFQECATHVGRESTTHWIWVLLLHWQIHTVDV